MHAKSVGQIHFQAADRATEELHVEITQDMLDCANNNLEFMKTTITGDKTWVMNQKANFNLQMEAFRITKAQKSTSLQ